MGIVIPVTGQGDATPAVATDLVGGVHYQKLKLAIGADGTVTALSTANPLPVREPGPATSVVAGIPGSTSTVSRVLLAGNAGRRGATIYNDVPGPIGVALAGTASSDAYTVQLPQGSFYEIPPPVYRGIVSAIWLTTSTGGAVMATELTD